MIFITSASISCICYLHKHWLFFNVGVANSVINTAKWQDSCYFLYLYERNIVFMKFFDCQFLIRIQNCAFVEWKNKEPSNHQQRLYFFFAKIVSSFLTLLIYFIVCQTSLPYACSEEINKATSSNVPHNSHILHFGTSYCCMYYTFYTCCVLHIYIFMHNLFCAKFIVSIMIITFEYIFIIAW